MISMRKEYEVARFILVFVLAFCFFYYGTILMIGLASEDGYYSKFVHDHLDYVSWLKISYIKGTGMIMNLLGYETNRESGFLIRILNGRGVIIAYDCVGYGVMSFWAAYVLSCKSAFTRKLLWLFIGLFSLWFINLWRISLFLLAINKGWKMPLGIDHHTWFNIIAYLFIFLMIYFFEKNQNKHIPASNTNQLS